MATGFEQKKIHHDLKNVGLRAQATSVGLVQLCKELKSAGVIDDGALGRIKEAIADEIALTAPRSILRSEYRREICQRLDAIFAGEQRLGDANELDFASRETN